MKLSLTFGPSNILPDPTSPLQEYLRANGNKLPAPLSEKLKLLTISISPPGMLLNCNSLCYPGRKAGLMYLMEEHFEFISSLEKGK